MGRVTAGDVGGRVIKTIIAGEPWWRRVSRLPIEGDGESPTSRSCPARRYRRRRRCPGVVAQHTWSRNRERLIQKREVMIVIRSRRYVHGYRERAGGWIS